MGINTRFGFPLVLGLLTLMGLAGGSVIDAQAATPPAKTTAASKPAAKKPVTYLHPVQKSTAKKPAAKPASASSTKPAAQAAKPASAKPAASATTASEAKASETGGGSVAAVETGKAPEAAAGISAADKKRALQHLDKASFLGSQNKLDEAMKEYHEALRINPKLADARVGISTVYGIQGKWPEAIEELKGALKTPELFADKSNIMKARFNLSASYCMNKQPQEAFDNYRQNIKGKSPDAARFESFLKRKCPLTANAAGAVKKPVSTAPAKKTQ